MSATEYEPLLCTSCGAPLADDSPDGRCGTCTRVEDRLLNWGAEPDDAEPEPEHLDCCEAEALRKQLATETDPGRRFVLAEKIDKANWKFFGPPEPVARGQRITAERWAQLRGEVPEPPVAAPESLCVVTLDEFIGVDEPGAEPLLGDAEANLIPQGGDIMVYGDGGAGKTTLMVDAAFHLASGERWLGIPVPRPVRVMLVENEGPRSQLRRKLKRKRAAWQGRSLDTRLHVFEAPWRGFTVGEQAWRDEIARTIEQREIDLLIAGPLVTIGMDTHGTLQEVRAFTEWLDDVRRRSRRPLAVALIHHENKAGDVSGAWAGALDTALHVQSAGNGHTILYVKKARWDSSRHGTTLNLAWDGVDAFRLEGDRDYLAEVTAYLEGDRWLSVREIAQGIEAGEQTVKPILADNPGRFELRSGDAAKALGRSPNAKLFGLRSTSNVVEVDPSIWGAGERLGSTPSSHPLKRGAKERSRPESERTTDVYVERSAQTAADRARAWHAADDPLARLQREMGYFERGAATLAELLGVEVAQITSEPDSGGLSIETLCGAIGGEA